MMHGIGNSSQMMSQMFSKLDSKNQGYLEKSDFSSAFSKISGNSNSSSSTSADDVFAALDTNGDGKVTKNEFSDTLSKLQEQLDSQLNQTRMQGGPQGMGGMPPPPPQNDQGLSKEELQSQLSEIGSTDSQGSGLLSKIANNFEAADSNGDGKVSFSEAQHYDQSSSAGSSSGSSSSISVSGNDSSSASAAASSDAQLMMKIMQLMHAYGAPEQQQSNLSSLLSTTA